MGRIPHKTASQGQQSELQSNDAINPTGADLNDPRYLRQRGQFAQALVILERRQKEQPSVDTAIEILSIIEDTGDALTLVKRSREYSKLYPNSKAINWLLTKGLLFAGATFKHDPKYEADFNAWLEEAESHIATLEKSGWSPQEVPGYLPILKAELAFLRENWSEAEQYCREGLKLGTTAGESGDLYATLFDVACRQGKAEDAESYLDQALQVVAKASANSYYGLRMFREEALIIKDFILDKHFTEEQLNELWKIHSALQSAGFVDPTSPDDSEAVGLHNALHTYAAKFQAQDYAACLQIIQTFIDNKPNHTPRCFFSEAVMSPLRPLYLNMAAGKLCKLMGDKERARAYFQAAAQAHPQDVMVQRQLDSL